MGVLNNYMAGRTKTKQKSWWVFAKGLGNPCRFTVGGYAGLPEPEVMLEDVHGEETWGCKNTSFLRFTLWDLNLQITAVHIYSGSPTPMNLSKIILHRLAHISVPTVILNAIKVKININHRLHSYLFTYLSLWLLPQPTSPPTSPLLFPPTHLSLPHPPTFLAI